MRSVRTGLSCLIAGSMLMACGTKIPDTPEFEGVTAWCEPTFGWSAESKEFEEEVLVIVNERRSEGANCGGEGDFAPAAALTMSPQLRCAARMHSRDMKRRDFFSHTNEDGDGPQPRIEASGYDWWTWGENIARGQGSPESVMQSWMGSDGHCSNIMNADFSEIGVGYYDGAHWTQVFGAPAG